MDGRTDRLADRQVVTDQLLVRASLSTMNGQTDGQTDRQTGNHGPASGTIRKLFVGRGFCTDGRTDRQTDSWCDEDLHGESDGQSMHTLVVPVVGTCICMANITYRRVSYTSQ
jgi:hypothetical protein